MKLNDFLTEFTKKSNSIKIWNDNGAMEEGLYAYFKDEDQLSFVFIALIGPIYMKQMLKLLELPFIDDIGLGHTIDDENKIFHGTYDLIIKLNEGIEDLELSECNCDCDEEQCEGCDECDGKCDTDKKYWN